MTLADHAHAVLAASQQVETDEAQGLPCPACESTQTLVVDSRARRYAAKSGRAKRLDPRVVRRRKCLACGARFSTEERYRDLDTSEEPTVASRLRALAAELERHTA